MKRTVSILLTLVFLLSMASTICYAREDIFSVDSLEQYVVYSQYLETENYLNIPVGLKTYIKDPSATTKDTPAILYVVNTQTANVGRGDDETIISGMLDRGYVVAVVDYFDHPLTATNDLDQSVQNIRIDMLNTGILANGALHRKYSHLVPQGYDIKIDEVYWSIDKHCADGSFDHIINSWNTDLLGVKGDLFYITFAETTVVDGVTFAAGEKLTLKEYTARLPGGVVDEVFECLGPDGKMVNMDYHMDVIYPVDPVEKVPFMLWSDSGDATNDSWNNRPHLNGFLFDGYAVGCYEFCAVPMAQGDNYGYYDGYLGSGGAAGAVTGDRYTFALKAYNGNKSDTAAVRMVRYKAETYNADASRIGIIGISKTGDVLRLGAEHPENRAEVRYFPGHSGETRYDNGLVSDIVSTTGIIRGGEEQPWLTYEGTNEAIPSNVQFIYTNVGGGQTDVAPGHAPVYIVGTMQPNGSYYDYYPAVMSQCYTSDVPVMDYVAENLGHALTVGPDRDTGNDTYAALYDMANYYLNGGAAKCEYIKPLHGTEDVDPAADITVKFNAGVPMSEVTGKVTIVNTATGKKVAGSWKAAYGNTLYTFSPCDMEGGYTYTVTVPASLCSENGKPIAAQKQVSFTATRSKNNAPATVIGDGTLSHGEEMIVTFEGLDFSNSNTTFLRFYVANHAANIVQLYAAEKQPDGTYTIGQTILDTVNLCGAGNYAFDVTKYVQSEIAAFCLKTQKQAGETVVSDLTFDGTNVPVDTYLKTDSIVGVGIGSNANVLVTDELNDSGKGQSLKFESAKLEPVGEYYDYYSGTSRVFHNARALKIGSAKAEDYGRRFRVTFSVYDTTDRKICAQLGFITGNRMINNRGDYYTFFSRANQWTDYSYEVAYDTEECINGLLPKENLIFYAENMGADSEAYPVYFDNIKVTEIITDVEIHAPGKTNAASGVSLVTQPVVTTKLDATEFAYVESGENADTVMDATGGVLISGQSVTLAENARKLYVKLPLNDYTANTPYVFAFDTDDASNGTLEVYGISDKAAAASWSSSTITYLNAPANDKLSNGVDINMVYGKLPIATYEVFGANTYKVDLLNYATFMKNAGADYMTLILVANCETQTHLLTEAFETNTTIFNAPGGGLSNKGKTQAQDHTTGNGWSYQMTPTRYNYERIKFDVLDYANMGPEDIGKTYEISFWVRSNGTGTLHIAMMPKSASTSTHVRTDLGVTQANVWQKLTYTVTMTAEDLENADVNYRHSLLQIRMNYDFTTGNAFDGTKTLYIDDIQVKEIGKGTIAVTPNTNVLVDSLVSIENFDDWTTQEKVPWGIKADTYSEPNMYYQYGFNKTATGYDIVETEDATSGNGKSFAFRATSSGMNVKFYGLFNSLAQKDIGRTFTVTFKTKIDKLPEGENKVTIKYGLTSALSRKDCPTNGLDGEVVDAKNYNVEFYNDGYTQVLTAEDVGLWHTWRFDITIDANMLPRVATLNGTNYNVGIGMLGVRNLSVGGTTIFIDDIIVTEAPDPTAEPPYSYKQNFETITDLSGSAKLISPATRYLDASHTSKTAIDKIELTTSEALSGNRSLKVTSHDYSNGIRLSNCFQLELGAQYTVSFWAKPNKAGNLWVALCGSNHKLYHNGAYGTYKAIAIPEANVGKWAQYSYTFTVDQTMIDDSVSYFMIRSGLLRNTTTIVCDTIDGKEVYNQEKSSPLIMYIDNIEAKEAGSEIKTSAEPTESISIGSDGTSSAVLVAQAKTTPEYPSGIRKAYIHFAADENNKHTQKAILRMNASQAAGQTVKIYGIIGRTLPEDLTYNNAPASNADESMNQYLIYGGAPLGEVVMPDAGTYEVDVTEYVKAYITQGITFALVTEDMTLSEESVIVLPEVSLDVSVAEKPVPTLTFAGAALELQNNLAIRYRVRNNFFTNGGFEDPYVVFTLNGVETVVSDYTVSGGDYIFTFNNIAPNQMNDTITAVLYASFDGVEYSSAPRNYSVAEYCYTQLNKYSADDYAELRTLLVDLLNYGAVSQQYTGYHTDNLVNAALTETQKGWATQTDRTYNNIRTTKYETIENPTVAWKGGSLVLKDAVVMRFRFETDNTDGLSFKITSGGKTWWINEISTEGGMTYIYFNGLNAGQMSDEVFITAYQNGAVVSNTVRYSVESYAAEKITDTEIPYLAEIVDAMMKYGDSAKTYVN